MDHDAVFAVWKPQGWTPLAAMHAFRKQNPTYQKATVSYAGRLDPMAEGVLILLVGDANKRRSSYEGLTKSYEAEMIFGITTDSLDALGIITHHDFRRAGEETVRNILPQFIGTQKQAYPIYSSKTVRGKPLYWWARRNKISEITIPHKIIEISSLECTHVDNLSTTQLFDVVQEKISNVTGDFRQKEILTAWKLFSETHSSQRVIRAIIRVSCSSGTYIRQLVSDIGEKLGCGALALSIVRTRVGDFTERQCVRMR